MMFKILRSIALAASLIVSQPLQAQVLATPAQLDDEWTTLRILDRPEMRAAIGRIEALYRADPRAATPAGKARIRRAAQSIGMASIHYALSEDVTRPAVIWATFAPHRWHGMIVPGSGFGIENPDNIYQGFAVAGGGHYVLHGHLPKPGPVQLHFEVRDSIPGLGSMQVEGFSQLATIQSEELEIDAKGNFTITIDSSPTGERRNQLQIPQDGAFNVGIRQLLTDWSVQRPARLRVERLDPAPLPSQRDIAALSRRAAEILDRIGPYWLDYNNRYIYSRPVNTISPPRLRPGGRGISTSGHYALAADEALVITADPLGAVSLGVQLADPWGVSYDYDSRSASLNNLQAASNKEGTITFVISARDPGYANWLDGGGFASGIVVLRWQGLPGNVDQSRGFRKVEVIKLSNLARSLPEGMSRVTPKERNSMRAARSRAYAVRLGD